MASTLVEPEKSENEDRIAALRVTWWGLGANVSLTGLKYGAGILSGSSALIADAAHSLSDLISDFVTLFVVQYARVPADEDHPYGHGRFEALGSLAVSGILIGTAGGAGWNALSTLLECWNSGAVENAILASGYGSVAIFACAASLITKEALYHATARVGRSINSQTLIANAWHHRSDALSSVAALVGVGGCLAGMPLLDPVSGLLVSGLVAKTGVEIGLDSAREVTEMVQEDDDTLERVKRAADATEGVMGVSKMRSRKMGPYSLVDLHVDVAAHITVSAAHHVAERLRHKIISSERHISEVLVHVEPHQEQEIDVEMSGHDEVERQVRDVLAEVPGIRGVAHVIIHYASMGLSIKVDIVCDDDITIREAMLIATNAKRTLEFLPGVYAVDIDLDLDV